MFEISIIKDGQPVLVTHTDTYVLAFVEKDISEPITQKMGNAALTAFLTMCLFAETMNLLAGEEQGPVKYVDATLTAPKPAPAGP